MEVPAAARALVFAREIGVDNIILEGDSSAVFKAFQGKDQSLSACGLLIDDVKLLSRSFFELLCFHTRREGNKLAHSLAPHAIKVFSFDIWMKFVPPTFHDVF